MTGDASAARTAARRHGRVHPEVHDGGRMRSYGAVMDGALTGGTYEIMIGAVLDDDWSAWFDNVDVRAVGTATVLRGTVADQAALHGLLARLRDLGVALLEVRHIEAAGVHDRSGGDPEVGPGSPDAG